MFFIIMSVGCWAISKNLFSKLILILILHIDDGIGLLPAAPIFVGLIGAELNATCNLCCQFQFMKNVEINICTSL